MTTARTPDWEQLAAELPQSADEQAQSTAQTPAEALRRAGLPEPTEENEHRF